MSMSARCQPASNSPASAEVTMVNTGKPSGACEICRQRRIKCDETKPKCLKCSRSGRNCPGYSHGLRLRDQTQKTIRKVKLGRPKARCQPPNQDNGKGSTGSVPKSSGDYSALAWEPPKTRASSPHAQAISRVSHGRGRSHGRTSSITTDADFWALQLPLVRRYGGDPLQWQRIDTPLVDQARCHFFSNYVVYGPRESDLGMFTFIPSLMSTDEGSVSYFQDLFSAVSIAAFSMRPNAKHIALYSHLFHGRGVAGLRKALEHRRLAKSDTALASTILLGVYEGLASDDHDMVAFPSHFKGAITLLRLRGPEQFSTARGTEMFDFVMEVLVRLGQPPWKKSQMRQCDLNLSIGDEDIKRWSEQAAKFPEANRPCLISMRVSDLRSKLADLLEKGERNMESIQKAMMVLMTAQEFEKSVERYDESETPSALSGRSISFAESPEEIPGKIMTYSDWWTATRWLNKYTFRLLLCHIIADASKWLGGSANPQSRQSLLKAAQTARDDIESIIGSIPYLCEWKGGPGGSPKGASSPCGNDDSSSFEGINNLIVIWPLFLTGKSQFATTEQREYIQRKLGWIGENMGVKHAVDICEARV